MKLFVIFEIHSRLEKVEISPTLVPFFNEIGYGNAMIYGTGYEVPA